jgi:hypothetical protein
MSDEERKAALEFLIRSSERFRDALKPLFKAVSDFVRKIGPLLAGLRSIAARYAWIEAQQTARFIAHHPDLAAMDGWLDRFYPDPACV